MHRSCAAWMEEVRFALDSPLEGGGFEPSVPRPRWSLSSATSSPIKVLSPPSAATAASASSALRAATTIWAPAAASPRAIPSPIPPLPPVTFADLPERDGVTVSSYWHSKRNLPRDFRRGRPAGVQVRFRCSKHEDFLGDSRQPGRSDQSAAPTSQ